MRDTMIALALGAVLAIWHVRVLGAEARGPHAFAEPDQTVILEQPTLLSGIGTSPDGAIVEYRWDFDGDSSPDAIMRGPEPVMHRFARPGVHRVVLTVVDSAGATASAVRRVTAVEPNEDSRPDRVLEMTSAGSRPGRAADGSVHRYAVLLNGGHEERYRRDITLAYSMLAEGYGFPEANIYVLNYDGTSPGGGIPCRPADFEELDALFDELSLRADGDDEIFMLISDHGRGYSGPQSVYFGYLDGRASVDPRDEADFLESEFRLRSLFTGGDYRSNHGMNVWRVRRQWRSPDVTEFYRNKYVSRVNELYVEELGRTVSDRDIDIERLVDYAMGDLDRNGLIETQQGELFDYDGDGVPPFDSTTGAFDKDDWGKVDRFEDDHNTTNGGLPEGAYPIRLFDHRFEGRLCIDLGYRGGTPHVDGRDDDNAGLFDWMDVNQDGDLLDVVSVDEGICLHMGTLFDDELAELIGRLTVGRLVVVALPCFSGGLIEDLAGANRVICAATTEESESWGNTFVREFIAALHGQDAYGNLIAADADGNRRVNMLEAFNYAAAHDFNSGETPQYDDDGDGISRPYPLPADGEGSVGAATHLCEEWVRIQSLTVGGESVTIRWNKGPGFAYTVEWSADMADWTSIPVGSAGAWTGANTGDGARIYRVRRE